MKATIRFILVFIFSSVMILTSCRKEETEFIETPPEDVLQPNSLVANLLQRTASNDGSNDNILDLANCFNIKLPVNVTANSIHVEITNENDYYLVETIFDEDYDDIDALEINFPITIVNSDYTEVSINSMSELNANASNCNGENISDNDIECIDFVYPFTASKFNPLNELISTETFTNDNELYDYIEAITPDDITSIDFPISVVLSDDSQMTINSLTELENIITNEQNSCDEDDDYDYNDDDCNHCTQELLEDFLTGCQNWFTDKVRQDNTDYNDVYDGYDFNFFEDGTITVFWNMTSANGTWSTEGTGNNMSVLINIPALTFCNNNWSLQEIINDNGLNKIDLRLNEEDRLRYRNTCN
ncbi:hypothetical protein [uncultured Psychroserpens sp.]|uniref:hypothetical protein n=1 Tax=uncultured Psychroserpens sp. TaxID=255436 RepID=UPI002618262C|nr:hypothetical protein [uncultured Psychroserpens sp.]